MPRSIVARASVMAPKPPTSFKRIGTAQAMPIDISTPLATSVYATEKMPASAVYAITKAATENVAQNGVRSG